MVVAIYEGHEVRLVVKYFLVFLIVSVLSKIRK